MGTQGCPVMASIAGRGRAIRGALDRREVVRRVGGGGRGRHVRRGRAVRSSEVAYWGGVVRCGAATLGTQSCPVVHCVGKRGRTAVGVSDRSKVVRRGQIATPRCIVASRRVQHACLAICRAGCQTRQRGAVEVDGVDRGSIATMRSQRGPGDPGDPPGRPSRRGWGSRGRRRVTVKVTATCVGHVAKTQEPVRPDACTRDLLMEKSRRVTS